MSLDVTMSFPIITGNEPLDCVVYEMNITHNLVDMAIACGLYNPMWRPYKLYNVPDEKESEFKYAEAGELADAIRHGVKELESNPEKYKKLNPENGWGTYDDLLRIAKEYLSYCDKYPYAEVKVSR